MIDGYYVPPSSFTDHLEKLEVKRLGPHRPNDIQLTQTDNTKLTMIASKEGGGGRREWLWLFVSPPNQFYQQPPLDQLHQYCKSRLRIKIYLHAPSFHSFGSFILQSKQLRQITLLGRVFHFLRKVLIRNFLLHLFLYNNVTVRNTTTFPVCQTFTIWSQNRVRSTNTVQVCRLKTPTSEVTLLGTQRDSIPNI